MVSKRYTYFVSYAYNGYYSGFGSIEIGRATVIDGYKDILEIARALETGQPGNSFVILWFSLLRTEET